MKRKSRNVKSLLMAATMAIAGVFMFLPSKSLAQNEVKKNKLSLSIGLDMWQMGQGRPGRTFFSPEQSYFIEFSEKNIFGGFVGVDYMISKSISIGAAFGISQVSSYLNLEHLKYADMGYFQNSNKQYFAPYLWNIQLKANYHYDITEKFAWTPGISAAYGSIFNHKIPFIQEFQINATADEIGYYGTTPLTGYSIWGYEIPYKMWYLSFDISPLSFDYRFAKNFAVNVNLYPISPFIIKEKLEGSQDYSYETLLFYEDGSPSIYSITNSGNIDITAPRNYLGFKTHPSLQISLKWFIK